MFRVKAAAGGGSSGAGDHDWLNLQAWGFLVTAALIILATTTVVLMAIVPGQIMGALLPLLPVGVPVVIAAFLLARHRRGAKQWFGALGRGLRRVPFAAVGWNEVALRLFLFALGLVAVGAAMSYAAGLPTTDNVLTLRLNDIGSMVSPVLFILLAGGGLSLFCLWDLARVQGLLVATPFERALASRAGAEGSSLTVLAKATGAFRHAVFRVAPLLTLVILVLGGIALAFWLGDMTSVEAVAAVPNDGGDQAFAFLHTSSILGLLLVIGWATVRLYAVWVAADRVLEAARVAGLTPSVKAAAAARVPHNWAGFATDTESAPSYAPLPDPAAPAQSPAPDRKETIAKALDAWSKPAENLTLGSECCLYLEWLEQHVRNYVYLLGGALAAGPLLLSSYPFFPEHRAKIAFTVFFVAALLVMFRVIVRENRDPLLSTVNGTSPGKLSLNSDFVRIFVISILLPLLSIVLSEVPQLQAAMSWADPLIKGLVR
ncbi:MAG: hypothetical protein ACKVZ0_17210 [Gemmatimonadales bacterium]